MKRRQEETPTKNRQDADDEQGDGSVRLSELLARNRSAGNGAVCPRCGCRHVILDAHGKPHCRFCHQAN